MTTRQTNNLSAAAVKKNQTTKKQQTKSGKLSTKTIRASGKSSTVKTKKQVVPTHERISERAKAIWQQRNCMPGEDERNWFEAENQLIKQELGIL